MGVGIDAAGVGDVGGLAAFAAFASGAVEVERLLRARLQDLMVLIVSDIVLMVLRWAGYKESGSQDQAAVERADFRGVDYKPVWIYRPAY